MHMHVHTCIHMSTRVFCVNKEPQHMFLKPINDLKTHFWSPGAGPKRSQVPQGSPKAVPKLSQGVPSSSQGTPRDPKAFCNKNKQIS